MKRKPYAIHFLVLCFSLFVAIQGSAQSAGSLSSILNPDGSVRSDISGSFDPEGYRLSFGPNGEPRFASASTQPLGTTCNDGWSDLGFTINGVAGGVTSIVSDGAGNLYVGGNFSAIYNTPARAIAKWNGSTWSALGAGINGEVRSVAISGTDVYVAGLFESAGGVAARNVAKWNGSAWSAIGAGVGGQNTLAARAIAVSGTTIYAGGNFGILRWDGSTWSGMGPSGTEGIVSAIGIVGSDVYVGGFFPFAGGIPTPGLAKWNGTSWSAVGTGLGSSSGSPSVEAITVVGGDVYVGGTFETAGGTTTNNIAKWNGTSWSAVGSGVSGGRVTAITAAGTDIYVGGFFSGAGGNPASRIAKWNGTQWSALGSGTSDLVTAIGVLGSDVLVGGHFTTAGGLNTRSIAMWNAAGWSGFPGNNFLQGGVVRGVAVAGTDVYLVGTFTTAGSLTVNNVVKWNGTGWSTLGTGVPGGSLNTVAVSGNNVYVGGFFSSAGGTNANNIARWNGSSWSQLGSGVSGPVFAITIVGQDIYVGGNFATAGGQTARNIARWNGTAWSGLNSPAFISSVGSIVPAGQILYVGTGSTTVDSANYFLKYDGTTWTPLGNGMTNGGVSSLVVSGNDVYVAGGFTSVGGVAGTNRIAKWNNGTWSALGTGLPAGNGGLSNNIDIALAGSELIAVGDFQTGAGGPANRIARWNGSAWLPMGAGLNSTGHAISTLGGDIYVAGEFTAAGCRVSPYFARWRQTEWTGAVDTDWHNTANWGGATLPSATAGVTISANNATISSADVTVASLIVASSRNITIGAGRTLTVTGNLDLSAGAINGPGTLVVNGNLELNGDIFGLAGLTINGGLTINNGRIDGGPVTVTSCTVGAIGGGGGTSFIAAPLTRCVNSSGIYRFPVGTGSVYAPVELANVAGSGNFTVEPKSGAFPGAVTGLSTNRLQRWWQLTNGGITQADVTVIYPDAEVVGLEAWYRVFRINGGSATQLPTTLNQGTNRATSVGVTSFSAWTLAEGQPFPRTFSGRVTNPNGRGAAGIIVSLLDGGGNTRYAVTNSFGYYRFMEVDTYRTYTVTVNSKKFSFTSTQRVVNFDELTTSVNFVSTDN